MTELRDNIKAALPEALSAWDESDGGSVTLGWVHATSPQNMRQVLAYIAELEAQVEQLKARAVTLPERYSCDLGYNGPDPNGDMLSRDEVQASLTAAGIKWEAE